jgi:chromosome segregation ATPase
MFMQVEIKEQRLSGLRKEIGQLTDEVVSQRERCKDADQMLAKEKRFTDGVRAELKTVKEQLSSCKTKLGAALRETAEVNVKASGA